MAKKRPKVTAAKNDALSSAQLRRLNMTGTVRLPCKYSVAELSIVENGKHDWAVMIIQDRGYSVERRIVDLNDVGVVSMMRDNFKREVDDLKSPLRNEDWDEWSELVSESFCGKEEILGAFENPRQPGMYDRTRHGAVFVKAQANVLVEAAFGLPAYQSADWASPLAPPETIVSRSGRLC